MSAYITCITYVGTEFGQEPNYFFFFFFLFHLWRFCLFFGYDTRSLYGYCDGWTIMMMMMMMTMTMTRVFGNASITT